MTPPLSEAQRMELLTICDEALSVFGDDCGMYKLAAWARHALQSDSFPVDDIHLQRVIAGNGLHYVIVEVCQGDDNWREVIREGYDNYFDHYITAGGLRSAFAQPHRAKSQLSRLPAAPGVEEIRKRHEAFQRGEFKDHPSAEWWAIDDRATLLRIVDELTHAQDSQVAIQERK